MKEHVIEQIIEKKEVQTSLVIKCDGVIVYYTRLVDKFAYKFTVRIGEYDGECKTKEEAKEVCLNIVNILENQSYDHGAEWRRTDITEDTSMVDRYGMYSITVGFRIKDIY